jgi:hypothetical protein
VTRFSLPAYADRLEALLAEVAGAAPAAA